MGAWSFLNVCPYLMLNASVLSRLGGEKERGNGVWICCEHHSDHSELEFPPL